MERVIGILSRVLDVISGAMLVVAVGLVVANVILRTWFGRPVLGTYEYVGLITAVVIGLALARCSVEGAHIAVEYMVERLPPRVRSGIEFLGGLASTVLLVVLTRELVKYGSGIRVSGQVSATTQTPIYPAVYLVGLGFLVLLLVVAVKTLRACRRVIGL